MKPLKAGPLIGDIAAQRLWGKGAATQRAVDILKGTFAQQRAFIEDPAKLKWALCTRRAAKSYSDGLALAKAALDRPDVSCLYIGLTRESAKRIMWKDVLKAINRCHKLGIQFNESELSAKFPNGSVIYLVGADSNEDERQKLLGQKFVLVVIDEAQAFGIDLRQLVYGVLKPAVADYRGTIVLTGTPGNLIKGLFFDVTNGREACWASPEIGCSGSALASDEKESSAVAQSDASDVMEVPLRTMNIPTLEAFPDFRRTDLRSRRWRPPVPGPVLVSIRELEQRRFGVRPPE